MLRWKRDHFCPPLRLIVFTLLPCLLSDKASDTVTKMIEKISQSKNPAEATAAMVAALATTTKFGNQRKLLLELTKKVDEQKRLLEQKRTKLGQSPVTSSPGSSASSVTSTPQPKKLSKDPRIRKQEMAAAAAAEKEMDSLLADGEDIDLRDRSAAPPQALVATVPPSQPAATASIIPTESSKPSSSILTSSLLKESVSSLLSLTSEISSSSSSSSAADSLGQLRKLSQDSTSAGKSGSDQVATPTGFYVDQTNGKPKAESLGSKSDSDDKDKVSETLETDSKTEEGEEDKADQNVQYDIVKNLQAEISGKPVVSESVKDETKPDDADTDDKSKSDETEASGTQVPNVTSLFKSLASGSSESVNKAGIQLPTALMSLFSKLPGSAEEPVPANPTIPGLFSNEESENDKTAKGENSEKPEAHELPGLGGISKTEKKSRKRGVNDDGSNSFLGFDYDSDSSGGSFEGFDDDGTRKLSPRKRKLVQKNKDSESVKDATPKANLFGDVDERIQGEVHVDEDLRQPVTEDVDLRQEFQDQDIDERVAIVPPPGVVTTQSMSFQPGLPMPYVPHDQPPPPGEEWSVPQPQPVIPPMSMGMSQMPMQDWAPPLPEIPGEMPPQPPLPAEPPAPKPPEPPMKKKKPEEEQWSDDDGSMSRSKKKKKKKDKKKKGETSTSDALLNQIVLQIAKKEPINPPPVPPVATRLIPGHYHGPPQSMMPMMHPDMMPISTSGEMIPGMNPMMNPDGVWDGGVSMGMHGWQGPPGMGPGMNTQAPLNPEALPPHMLPGVASGGPPRGPGFGHMGKHRPGNVPRPPSLLNMPTVPVPAKLQSQSHPSSDSPSSRDSQRVSKDFSDTVETPDPDMEPGQVDDGSEKSEQGKRDREERSRDRDEHGSRDRSDRRRHDRYRSRSRDRERDRRHRSRSHDRSRDHHRHRDRDRHYRSGRR